MIAIFDIVAGGIRPARAEIDGEHRLDAGEAAPVDELVGAEGVRLGRFPGEIEPPRPRLDGADAVLPIIAGDEIAAGIAHDGGAQLAHQGEHVAAKTVRIGGRVARLEDAAIDAAAEMLDEGAEQAAIGRADGEIPMKTYGDVTHGAISPSRENPAPPLSPRRATGRSS